MKRRLDDSDDDDLDEFDDAMNEDDEMDDDEEEEEEEENDSDDEDGDDDNNYSSDDGDDDEADESQVKELLAELKRRKNRGEIENDDDDESDDDNENDNEEEEEEDEGGSENEDGEGMGEADMFLRKIKKQRIGVADAIDTRNQQIIWSEIMKVWMKLESALSRVREYVKVKAKNNTNEKSGGELSKTANLMVQATINDEIQELTASMIELQTMLIDHGRAEIRELLPIINNNLSVNGEKQNHEKEEKEEEKVSTVSEKFSVIENELWSKYHIGIIEKWWERVNAVSSIQQKKLKSIAQSPLEQLESILKYRTLKSQQGEGQMTLNKMLDDDQHFYEQMLKDFVISDMAVDISSSSNGGSTGVASLKMRSQSKKKDYSDIRASKGRKLRYDVNEKLVNFMASKPNLLTQYTPISVIGELFRN